MPVISTSVSVSAGNTRALTISAGGNYLITAPTFLESENSYAVGIDANLGAVTINLAGSITASLSYFGIFQAGATDPLTLNILSSGSIFGGAIVSTASQFALTNYCYLYGQDSGISLGSTLDSVINRGEIIATSGLVIDLGNGDDRFYGGGGSVLGYLDLSSGNDIIDLRGAQMTARWTAVLATTRSSSMAPALIWLRPQRRALIW